MRHAPLYLVCLAAAACPAPHDYTPLIHVDPRAAARLDWIARPANSPGAARPRPARVHVMNRGEELGGPNTIGRPGDLVLENDEVVFVIDQLGASVGFAESGGNIVDAADARARRDELGQQFTCFGTFPRQGVYDTLTSGTSPEGGAWVEAKGRELYESKVAVTTRYTLQAPDRALLLHTTVENVDAVGGATVELPSLGDAIEWGGVEKIAPGKPRGFTGPSTGPFVGGVGRFTSYAITSVEGAIDATSGGAWTDTVQPPTPSPSDRASGREVRRRSPSGVKLAPGQKVSYSRVFVVGERPDSSSLVAELAQSAGQDVGVVEIALASAYGEGEVAVPSDARASVRDTSGAEVATIHAAGSPPRLRAALPVGHWAVAYSGGGGRDGSVPVQVDVTANTVAHARLAVTGPAGARVSCVDASGGAIPCKVTFERTDGAPPPDFGPASSTGPARNQVMTAEGVSDVALSEGAYRVTASRGPEYALALADLKLGRGDHAELRLSPTRVVDTAGYLACDFHQHTILSFDASVAARDRIISNAAEGVEVAVASEHNAVADLEPLVKELHLESALVSIPGDELTSNASVHPWGHANVFPMPYAPGQPRGGAPAVRDRAVGDIFGEVRRGRDLVVQINHPRDRLSGYFDLLGFDRATGVGSDPAYVAGFDTLEVWNGRRVAARAQVLEDFFALLRTGHPVTPTADTDTHGVVGEEPGYPRTYVRVADDTHLEAWDAARTDDLVRAIKMRRDVVLTNGPMLRVRAGVPAVGVGGLARGRALDVDVHIESAPWIAVDEVRLVRASAPGSPSIAPVHQKSVRGALVADIKLSVRAASDDAFVIIASGKSPMLTVLPLGDGAELLPYAISGPIWIDADGDGRSLGR